MIDNILQHPKEAVFENFKQSAFVLPSSRVSQP